MIVALSRNVTLQLEHARQRKLQISYVTNEQTHKREETEKVQKIVLHATLKVGLACSHHTFSSSTFERRLQERA